MGNVIKTTDTDRSGTFSWAPDNFPMTGLEVAAIFGGTLAQSIKNLAPGKSDLTVIGSPTVSADYITLKNVTNYLQTNVAESADMTLLSVRASAQVINAIDISNSAVIQRTGGIYPNGVGLRTSPFGSAPISDTQNFYSATVGYYSGTSGATANTLSTSSALTTEPSVDTHIAFSSRITSAGVLTRNDLTKSTSSSATIPGGNVRDTSGLLRIGSAGLGDATRADDLPLSMVFIWSRALSDTELINAAYGWIKSYYTRRSIVV